ncbi:MAG TPA: DMT family transporter [Gammaproteobacteria bacterium]|jgi:drug/metabolite transporter (DMT)-like permease|nr:DMT family transporter [Gammaproteobacteria bacterium]
MGTHQVSSRWALPAAALAVLLWSSSYSAMAYALRAFTPGEISFLRFALASAALAVPTCLGWIRLPPRGDWPAVVGLSFLGNVAYQLCLGYALVHITAGMVSVVLSMTPAATSALAVLHLKERLSTRAVAGLGIAFGGALLVTLGRGRVGHFESGALLVLLAVLLNAVYFVFQKPLLARNSAIGFTAASTYAAMLGLTPFALALPGKLPGVSAAQACSLLYLGVLPTVVGYLCWSWALARAPASRVSNFLYLLPVSGCAVAWMWLGELPTWPAVMGGVIALAGVALATAPAGVSRWLAGKFGGPAPDPGTS